MEPAVSQSVIEQFENSAKAAVATIEVIDRAPRVLCDAILKVAGDAGQILFAPPQDLPADLFANFVLSVRFASTFPGLNQNLRQRMNQADGFPQTLGKRLFYHSHCQQRTCNAAQQTIDVLRAAGFEVVTSSVECCGMAGSFGYKHDYYDLSMAVGADLFAQVQEADEEGGTRVLVASGVV